MTLVDAYVWDGVVIEDNCTVNKVSSEVRGELGGGRVLWGKD